MAVLDIRGTHGSGKSWIVHQLLARHPHEDIVEGGKAIGHLLRGPDAAVVGRYDRVCGGCDGIPTADEVVRRVRLLHGRHAFVILEGILVSHTFKRYDALAEELGDYRFLFLDTPLGNCIARVRARRRAAGNTRPLDPGNVTKDHYGVTTRVRRQVAAAGRYSRVLDWRDPLPAVLEELNTPTRVGAPHAG